MKKRFKIPFVGLKKKKQSTFPYTKTILELFEYDPPEDTDELIVFLEAWLQDAEQFLKEIAQDPDADLSQVALVEDARRQFRATLWDLMEAHTAALLAEQKKEEAEENCRKLVVGWTQKEAVGMMVAILTDKNTPDKAKALESVFQALNKYNPELLEAALEELNAITEDLKAQLEAKEQVNTEEDNQQE